MKTKERTHVEFNPIPCENGKGETCLSIYPPGQFINNEGFDVFVGGSGRGERRTLKAAKDFLLEKAKETCQERIESATATIQHYQAQLARLNAEGLQGEKVEPN